MAFKDNNMKQSVFTYIMVLMTLAPVLLGGCEPREVIDDPDKKDTIPGIVDPVDSTLYIYPEEEDSTRWQSARMERYRPQMHYTPSKFWVNDPNGLVYKDGVWHLYYQYNPIGNVWGNMSWGHATSTDLMHWEEQQVVLQRDGLGDIFSGSCIVDANNTAGFGAGAIIAMYTSAGASQQQSLAYSNDGGMTFTKYSGNPVIPDSRGNFRDPKVFWNKDTQCWTALLATGYDLSAEVWTSPNMKQWTRRSTLTSSLSYLQGKQWECPDLIKVDDKWVLILSVNPGGPIFGSGTLYMTGDFDGTTFTPDSYSTQARWLDFGLDNYASVSWSNAPDGRNIVIGWMNNWAYAGNVPCSPWRSAFCLPRELHFKEVDGKPILTSYPVKEIETLAGPWMTCAVKQDTIARIGWPAAWEASVTIPTNTSTTISFTNSLGQHFDYIYEADRHRIKVMRNGDTGNVAFINNFATSYAIPISKSYEELELHFFIDQSSIEMFSSDGVYVSTNLCFPKEMYHILSVSSEVKEARVRRFESIWNN